MGVTLACPLSLASPLTRPPAPPLLYQNKLLMTLAPPKSPSPLSPFRRLSSPITGLEAHRPQTNCPQIAGMSQLGLVRGDDKSESGAMERYGACVRVKGGRLGKCLTSNLIWGGYGHISMGRGSDMAMDGDGAITAPGYTFIPPIPTIQPTQQQQTDSHPNPASNPSKHAIAS